MNFIIHIKQQLPKGNNSKKGMMLLVAVVVLAGVILILMVGSYLATNAIRWQVLALPKSAQSFANAESCLAIALSKLKVSPTFNTRGNWQSFQKENIHCQYLKKKKNGKKIIKTKGFYSNYFKKISVELEM